MSQLISLKVKLKKMNDIDQIITYFEKFINSN